MIEQLRDRQDGGERRLESNLDRCCSLHSNNDAAVAVPALCMVGDSRRGRPVPCTLEIFAEPAEHPGNFGMLDVAFTCRLHATRYILTKSKHTACVVGGFERSHRLMAMLTAVTMIYFQLPPQHNVTKISTYSEKQTNTANAN